MKYRFKKVMRYDDRNKIIRICRVMWESGPKKIGHKLSFALQFKLFEWHKELWEWRVVFLGIRVHHIKSGGKFV